MFAFFIFDSQMQPTPT